MASSISFTNALAQVALSDVTKTKNNSLALKNLSAKKLTTPVSASLKLEKLTEKVAGGLAALGLSVALQLSPVVPLNSALASEANILQEAPPLVSHVVDDAGVLSRLTRSDLKRLLTGIEERTGYHIDFVTLRKITVGLCSGCYFE